MSDLSRRQLLAGFLTNLVQTAGTIVLARAVLSEASAQGKEQDNSASSASLQERADKLACEQGPTSEEDLQPVKFVNGGFRNGGGFRKGGFANGGGGFRNGGFGNGGGFRKGGFANGGFRNG